MVNLPHKIPVLSVWGDFIEKSPLWSDTKQQVREVLKNMAPDAAELDLNGVGLKGHSHQFMQDNGNDAVLNAIFDCVKGLGRQRQKE